MHRVCEGERRGAHLLLKAGRMEQLKHHSLNVFVCDRNGVPIPGARVQVFLDNDHTPTAEATTIGEATRPIRLQVPQSVSVVKVRATAEKHSKEVTADSAVGTVTLRFPEVVMPESNMSQSDHVPAWFPVVGVCTAALTILFFMALVILSTFGKLPPPQARPLVIMTLSLGAAFSFTFLGAKASARGHIPLPFAKEYPIAFSAAGGVATFIIILALAFWLYPA